MARTPTKPADADPLADLRGPVDGGTPTTTQEGRPGPVVPDPTPAPQEQPQGAGEGDVEPVLDENAQVLVIVQAWHRDLTAQSFGHSGGTCGCAYLARKAVKALRG